MKPVVILLYIFASLGTWSLVGCSNTKEQKYPPFWSEIQNFKRADSLHFPPPGGILFVGSSSFRKWTNLENVFKSYHAINRGFGGSNLLDAYRYADDIIFPYKPRQIIIYSGDNDIASDTVDARMVFSRFKALFNKIRQKMPEVPVAYISIKPSPLREKYMPISSESNTLIKDFLAHQKKSQFIDVYSLMLDSNGKPKPELFVDDKLHMNSKGYAIWEKAITPYLIK